jgi:F-type H+-transporting ATPase subunit a
MTSLNSMEETIHISLKAQEIFRIGSFPVTNGILLTVLVAIFLILIAILAERKFTVIPGKIQNIIEIAIEGILNLMDSVLGSRSKSEKYLPLSATIFLFVLLSNWSGLLPGVGSIGIIEGHELIPLLRSPAADLNYTLAIALVTVFTVNFLGILALGFRIHISKFITFKDPISFFIGILELISEFAKIISFSFRLFGNVFAGEVLLTITAFLMPYIIPLPFLFLEIFVGFIQAFIFTMLSIVFIAIATAEHEATTH